MLKSGMKTEKFLSGPHKNPFVVIWDWGDALNKASTVLITASIKNVQVAHLTLYPKFRLLLEGNLLVREGLKKRRRIINIEQYLILCCIDL